MTGRRSLGWTYNQAAKTKATEALERSRREAAATAEMSRRAAEPSNELSRAHEGSHKRTRRVSHRDELASTLLLAVRWQAGRGCRPDDRQRKGTARGGRNQGEEESRRKLTAVIGM